MADPYRFFQPARIAVATQCPEIAVRSHWPIIAAALERQGIDDRPTQLAAIGTVAIETASTFEPVREAFWLDEEWRRANLRYYPFYGRGYVQATWESNYKKYGDLLGIDLVTNPDRALEPLIAADILALYFANHGGGPLIPQAARRGDWREVRRLVQGGSAGLDRLLQIVSALGGDPMPLSYNPDAPIDQQPDSWSCSIQAVQFLLRSIGRQPDVSDPQGDPWLRSELVPGIVSPDVGLRDGSGRQLAEWISRTYGSEMGFVAQASPVTFDDVWAGAGVNPTIVGGSRFGPGGHWVGIRRRLSGNALEIANPAPWFDGITTMIGRDGWDARAPWHAIWIDRISTLPEPAPSPPLPTPPLSERLAAWRDEVRALLDRMPLA